MVKIRRGFVTNSSSSSYVVARKRVPLEVQKIINDNPMIKSYIQNFNPLERMGDVIEDMSHLNEWFMDNYGVDEAVMINHLTNCLADNDKMCWEDTLEMYDKYRGYIENNMDITLLQIDNHNSELMEVVMKMADGTNVIVECDE